MRPKIFINRLEIRLTKEHSKILKEIAKLEKTTESEAIRICIMEYWEKV